MNSTNLNINGLKSTFPIIQGGMGIGISLGSLAGHVAKCGGIGVISAAQIGFKEEDFSLSPLKSNLRALEKEVNKARKISPSGILGVNLMVAMKNYKEYVQKSIECGIDLIISGAGLPLELPDMVPCRSVKLVPIVSSLKAAKIICKMWDRKSNYTPDAIIVEGPLAGGHLGFKPEELAMTPPILDTVKDIKEMVKEYEVKYNKSIPVIVAGGIYSADDIQSAINAGADGVQMATRFVTTYECDAHPNFKQAYINATKEEIDIVQSPVGMPGRAIINNFISNKPGNSTCRYRCLYKCDVKNIPYCISEALIQAANGNVDNALLFCGTNAYKADKLEHVHDIFDEYTKIISS